MVALIFYSYSLLDLGQAYGNGLCSPVSKRAVLGFYCCGFSSQSESFEVTFFTIVKYFSFNGQCFPFSLAIQNCGTVRDDCHQFATCANTGPGTYKCTCNEGYTGDGKISCTGE